jgi:DNA-directed RNA polymerase specialized sigma24 family protein
MTLTDRELIHLAHTHLKPGDFTVWLAKHYHGLGRRAGSLALGISEETWRHRIQRATLTIDKLLAERNDPAA